MARLAEISSISNKINRSSTLSELIGDVMEEFGGQRKFVNRWISLLREAEARKGLSGPPYGVILHSYMAIGRLVGEAQKLGQSEGFDELSDVELREITKQLAIDELRKDPALLRECLCELNGDVVNATYSIIRNVEPAGALQSVEIAYNGNEARESDQ